MSDNDNRIVRIEDKIDKVVEHMGSIDITLSRLTDSVEHHVKRTNILEETISPLVEAEKKKHILDHAKHETRKQAIKGVLFLASVGAGLEGIIALIKWVSK